MIPEGLREEIWSDSYRAQEHVMDAVVVDVGANVGAFTIWAFEHGARHIYAVEPFEENMIEFAKNLRYHGITRKVTPVLAAAGETGVLEVGLRIAEDPTARSTGVQVIPGEGTPVVDLRDLVEMAGGHIDVLKLDCEGSEYPLMLSADAEVISMIDFITLEFHIWTVEGEHDVPGFGKRPPGEYPRHYELYDRLKETHDVEIFGHIDRGGYMVATLKGELI